MIVLNEKEEGAGFVVHEVTVTVAALPVAASTTCESSKLVWSTNSKEDMLLGGERVLETAPTSTPTAQLLTGGPTRRSPSDGGHHHQDDDPNSNVCYNFSSSQQEALQLYYVNAGFSQGLSSDGRSAVMTTLMYPPQNPDHTSHMHQPCEDQNDQYRAPFLPVNFADKEIHRRVLESAGPAEAEIPLGLGAHSESVNGSRSYSNWRSVGSEHSFLPMSKLSQNDHSQFGADLAEYRVTHFSQDMSHMHQTDHFQNDAAGHSLHLDVHTHGLSMSNGQGLSLSLSSHQQQSTALQFHSIQGGVASADHFHTVAAALQSQEAAIAQSKELASRYLTGSANSGLHLSRYHTPVPGEDVLGTGYQQHNLEVAGGRNHMDPNQSSGYTSVPRPSASHHIATSRFLKTAQDVLNEVCRVSQLSRKRAPKRLATSPEQQYNTAGAGSSTSVDSNFANYNGRDDRIGAMLSEAADSANDPAPTLPSLNAATHMAAMKQTMTESREELELKKGRLILMLDEVEARYRRYCDHLQLVITRFNSRAGPGAATPYTILALHAMSRHFRCLRDAIRHQLKVVKRALGEEEYPRGGETTRLRYIDQQMRQQRTLGQQQQQLDMQMQQQNAWRPQRGLPERAVSVLRGWLFEHFLQPYPKDVDKLSLAKQTGLTRSQVSNWFINARVRLWKPMVEEMYLEEQKEAEEAEASGRMQEKADEADSANNNFKHYGGGKGY